MAAAKWNGDEKRFRPSRKFYDEAHLHKSIVTKVETAWLFLSPLFFHNIRTDFDHPNARDITEELCPGLGRRIHNGRSTWTVSCWNLTGNISSNRKFQPAVPAFRNPWNFKISIARFVDVCQFFHVVANCSGRSKLRSKHRCVVGCSQVRQSMQYVV